MIFKQITLYTLSLLLTMFCSFPVAADVTIEPHGIAVSAEEEAVETVINIFNDGDNALTFEIDLDKVDREEQRHGPRRDEVDLSDMMFAVFQDAQAWNFLDVEMMDNIEGMQRLNLNDQGEGYHTYRNGGAWEDVEFEDYNVIVIGGCRQSQNFINAYRNNYERFCDYIDGGGAAYFEMGDANQQINSPGDITNDGAGSEANGRMVVSPDPEDDNYSLFAEICNESQGDNLWTEGHVIIGNQWTHCHYSTGQFENNDEIDWFEVIAVKQNAGTAGAIAYTYGSGCVLTQGGPTGYNWRNHQQPGRWGSIGGEILFYLTEMVGPGWMILDVEEGEIGPGEDLDITAQFMPEELEQGVYELLAVFEFDNHPTLELSLVMSVNSPSATVEGIVTDEETEEAVEGVFVDLYYYEIQRYSGNQGQWSMTDLPSMEHAFTFSAEDYLPETHVVDLGEDDIELNVSLRHSELALEPAELAVELAPEDSEELDVTGTNAGNGPLTYTTDRRLLGDANAEPWEHRVGVPAGVIAEDSRIQGAVFVNDHFYASGANNREPLIHVFNRDQELVNQYAQLGEGRYGYKDLASDGEVIWGSGERAIYGFNTDGEEVMSFDSGISPCNNLAWDPDREILWVSGTTTDIIGFDREGNQVGDVGRHGYRVYGLAYWPDDPDGCQLYIFHKINEVGDLMIAKVDIENDRTMDVANLMHDDGGVAQGCFITNQYDIYSWVFLGVANNGAEDRIDIWQVDARKDWMGIEPSEGVIEAGEQQDFVVTLDATELPQALFEGEIVFLHDGVGGETHLPVSLQVGEGGGPEEQVLNLDNGWNMVSAYVQPDPDDVREITAGLVEAGTLIMMKNSIGQFYNPQFNFNNIPGWRVEEGYMMKMDEAAELTLTGEPVSWDEPLALDEGWQIISYYPRDGVDAVLALSGIVDVLIMAKDGQGRFYNPQFNFSNMGDMVPGQGYLLKMDEAAELVYTMEEEVAGISTPFIQPSILPVHDNTGTNMSLLVLSDMFEGEVGIYSNDILVGSGVIQDGRCGVSVWGDDPTTPRIDGALKGESLEISLYDGKNLHAVEFESVAGENGYSTDGFFVIRLLDIQGLPEDFSIVDVYPNPFNSSTSLTYTLPEASRVEVAVFDLIGRQVVSILQDQKHAGFHTISIDGTELSSGVYIVQIQANERISKRKLTLIK